MVTTKASVPNSATKQTFTGWFGYPATAVHVKRHVS